MCAVCERLCVGVWTVSYVCARASEREPNDIETLGVSLATDTGCQATSQGHRTATSGTVEKKEKKKLTEGETGKKTLSYIHLQNNIFPLFKY